MSLKSLIFVQNFSFDESLLFDLFYFLRLKSEDILEYDILKSIK